jgi:hypothetical protein
MSFNTPTKFNETSLASTIDISYIEAMPLSNVCIELVFQVFHPKVFLIHVARTFLRIGKRKKDEKLEKGRV